MARLTRSSTFERLQSSLVVLALLASPACRDETREPPASPVAGAELCARAEKRLGEAREELRESIGHYGLVFPVEQTEIRRFLARIRLHRDGPDIVMGSLQGTELHGGGVLGLIVDHWRPGGRRPRLDDRYPFSWSRGPVALEEIYRSHKSQVFLPVPGTPREEIDGALPESPQLARMRFEHAAMGGRESSEVDAYTFMRLLLAFEPDPGSVWTNRLGQRLSVELLLDHAWDHYTVGRSAAEESDDHSYLHLVEVLLAYHRSGRSQRDPDELKRRFLSGELRRTGLGGNEDSEALGHYAESLGLLLAEPDLEWSEDERRRVRGWLEDLETRRLRDVEAVPVQHLSHLVRGLRLVEEHADKLGAG
ncbi:MAG: hypothetical protein ACQGVK_03960 [Myxococcota bacterium]